MLPSVVSGPGEDVEFDQAKPFEDLRHFGAFVGVDRAAV